MFDEMFKLRDIFAPHEGRIRNGLLAEDRRLIHYTSADNAISIIRGNQIWMKNIRLMNDFREVDHGFDLLKKAYTPPNDDAPEIGLHAIRKALNEVFPDVFDKTVALFDQWFETMRASTHIVCLSEHDKDEDDFGRLSMWRAYGSRRVGVGLVINPLPLYLVAENFGAFSSPVFYCNEKDVMELFLEIAGNIRRDRDAVAKAGADDVGGYLFQLLRALSICSKHRGFREEREWRIMHTKGLDDQGALKYGIESMGGVPQGVFKLSFEDRLDLNMTGISIPQLLQRVFIGPTEYPDAVRDAFCQVLSDVGVKEPRKLVVCSDIPLRT
ncbi:DUF2971 domain-containing protein [Agrobacterium rosae]|uniref:DUF2971 domain-containing protein n=1 Tax=Agrobacterium rosae TaxID=1972867 RepID=A0ABU4W062_9HYPH|nr:DUF2971 domain-containing protein [Agrobacterium rosae]MDX8330674.1 DUF2971 domain-containing protein [Agrobacterium rosae]